MVQCSVGCAQTINLGKFKTLGYNSSAEPRRVPSFWKLCGKRGSRTNHWVQKLSQCLRENDSKALCRRTPWLIDLRRPDSSRYITVHWRPKHRVFSFYESLTIVMTLDVHVSYQDCLVISDVSHLVFGVYNVTEACPRQIRCR